MLSRLGGGSYFVVVAMSVMVCSPAYAANECGIIAVGGTGSCTSSTYIGGIDYQVAGITLDFQSGVVVNGAQGVSIGNSAFPATYGALTFNALNAPSITTTNSAGLMVFGSSAAITVQGGNISTNSMFAHGIQAIGAAGDVNIVNTATIAVGADSNAIDVSSAGVSGASIVSHANLSAGQSAIYALDSGSNTTLSATVSGVLSGGSDNNPWARRDVIALYAQGQNGSINADFQSGSITIASPTVDGAGIYALAENNGSGNVYVTTALGTTITTSGAHPLNGEGQMGIYALTKDPFMGSNTGTVTVLNGSTITTNGLTSDGIRVNAANGAATATTMGSVSANGNYAVGISALGDTSTVTVGTGATVSGGWQIDTSSVDRSGVTASGIALSRNVFNNSSTLNNNGTVGALSDRALLETDLHGIGSFGTLAVNNHGTITGFVDFGWGSAVFRNFASSSFDMRHFADTDGDGTRDTKRISFSDFGGGNDTFLNEANGKLSLSPINGAVTTDDTGYYVPTTGTGRRPLETSFYDFTRNGLLQGQLISLEVFDNAGIIDLRGSVVGNTLLITGGFGGKGNGVNGPGGGVFISNGGELWLNAVLNDGIPLAGQTNSYSDMLIVDSTQVGQGGATAVMISVDPASAGALTVGNGIEVIEVLDPANSDPGAFSLGNRVVAGAYEYLLYYGGVAGDANDGNWYLRSTLIVPSPVNTNSSPSVSAIPNIRSEVAVNMVVPPLAIEYGFAMIGTLHERIGESRTATAVPIYEDREVWCKDPEKNFRCTVRVPLKLGQKSEEAQQQSYAGAWGRLIGERGTRDRGDFVRYGSDYDYTIGAVQVGLDLWAREHDGNLDKAGLYVGYGLVSSDVDGLFGRRAGSVDMNGYSIGGYWTHYAATGWYTDAIIQGTFYETEAKSVLGERIDPNGWGAAASIEGGYAFKFGGNWAFEPQAQLAYQWVGIGHDYDRFGIFSYGDWNSLRGRLGARILKAWDVGGEKTPRFVNGWIRANVWHEFLDDGEMSATNLLGNNSAQFLVPFGGTWGEVGAGVSGQVSDATTVFATGSYSRSLDGKGQESWDGRLGLTVKW